MPGKCVIVIFKLGGYFKGYLIIASIYLTSLDHL